MNQKIEDMELGTVFWDGKYFYMKIDEVFTNYYDYAIVNSLELESLSAYSMDEYEEYEVVGDFKFTVNRRWFLLKKYLGAILCPLWKIIMPDKRLKRLLTTEEK